MTFIDLYLEKVLKHDKKSRYNFIKSILEKIKKHLSLEEYGEILCNYFSCSSQWIHFKHFISLLSNETHSYDKLGYLIIISDKDKSENEKLQCIIRFIQERCTHKNIETKFWEMLKPHRRDLQFCLKEKLYVEYDFIDFFNWYGIDKLINNINKYTIDFNKKSNEEIFKLLKINMKLGYSNLEFYNNIIPFIIRYYYSMNYDDNNNEIIFTNLLEHSISYESFVISKINDIHGLEEYIKQKCIRVKMIFEMINDFIQNYNSNNDDNLSKINNFINRTFNIKYKYFYKKLNIIATKEHIKYLSELCQLSNINENITVNYRLVSTDNQSPKDTLFCFLKKLLIFNDKLNVSLIPLNNFGFELVMKNYRNGVKEIQFNNEIKLFIKRLVKNIIKSNFIQDSSEFNILVNLKIEEKITFLKFQDEIETFYDLVNTIKFLIENYNENIKLKENLINNLCF